MTIDALAKEVEDLADLLLGEDRSGRDRRPICLYFDTKPAETVQHPGPQDPWKAIWYGFTGTGSTCEMALLELRARIAESFDKAIAEEQRRAELASNRAALMRAAMASVQSTAEKT